MAAIGRKVIGLRAQGAGGSLWTRLLARLVPHGSGRKGMCGEGGGGVRVERVERVVVKGEGVKRGKEQGRETKSKIKYK